MKPYNFNRETVISGDTVLVGGNCFAGTYNGISNMYSAFYDTWWTMSATGKFVGSDQKVMYRTCHTYPTACHIHKASKGYGRSGTEYALAFPALIVPATTAAPIPLKTLRRLLTPSTERNNC